MQKICVSYYLDTRSHTLTHTQTHTQPVHFQVLTFKYIVRFFHILVDTTKPEIASWLWLTAAKSMLPDI